MAVVIFSAMVLVVPLDMPRGTAPITSKAPLGIEPNLDLVLPGATERRRRPTERASSATQPG